MKKLRLSNIFHWLYAFLMFLPIIFVFGYVISTFGTGNFDYSRIFVMLSEFGSIFRFAPVDDVFLWIGEFLAEDGSYGLVSIFSYWVCISFAWLVFDIVMFMINLAHRWIDKGGIE